MNQQALQYVTLFKKRVAINSDKLTGKYNIQDKVRICTILYDHLYSSTQPELS